MIDKLELRSGHEVIDTVNVANIESIFQGKPTDPDILTVLMTNGKRLYCDEVCPINQESVYEDLESAANKYSNVEYNYMDMMITEYDGTEHWVDDKYFIKDAFIAGGNWQRKVDIEDLFNKISIWIRENFDLEHDYPRDAEEFIDSLKKYIESV